MGGEHDRGHHDGIVVEEFVEGLGCLAAHVAVPVCDDVEHVLRRRLGQQFVHFFNAP